MNSSYWPEPEYELRVMTVALQKVKMYRKRKVIMLDIRDVARINKNYKIRVWRPIYLIIKNYFEELFFSTKNPKKNNKKFGNFYM